MDTAGSDTRPVALVTGAASGIGAATAERLGEDGFDLLLVDIDGASGSALARTLAGPTVAARFVEGDVSQPETWHRVRAICDDLGRLDLLCINAGVLTRATVEELSPQEWNNQIGINLTQTFLAARSLMSLLRSTRGSMVCVSSVHARFGLKGCPAYAASKGGIEALVRQLAVEYGPEVRVNAVVPGGILTPAWDDVSESGLDAASSRVCLQRLGRPGEVASIVSFLGSADASYVTGASIVVDGGWGVWKEATE